MTRQQCLHPQASRLAACAPPLCRVGQRAIFLCPAVTTVPCPLPTQRENVANELVAGHWCQLMSYDKLLLPVSKGGKRAIFKAIRGYLTAGLVVSTSRGTSA